MDPHSLNQSQAMRYVKRLAPEHICQVLRPHMTGERIARIDEVLAYRLGCLTVVVENLHDPHNGAAALRSAEAVGLQGFHAVQEREPFSAAKGISLQCEQWMDVHHHDTIGACYADLRRDGFKVWAAVPDGRVPLQELPDGGRVALVFGNERDGLTPGALAEADGAFSIPMQGFTGSFNLSVSVALSVFSQAARMRRTLGAPGDLPPSQVEGLRALWYCLSVRAAGLILDRELARASHQEQP